ncbi:MAG: Ppx/GppA family phosphatase [Deltaproteobacteria bacterium]|nr:Ppx/GppA family phosphatase [Deltaproteobacteria bacterium]
MSEKRLAAIDIGTSSIRCIVVEVDPKNGFRVLDDEKANVRLGEGLTASGRIAPASWEQAREALIRMRKIADGCGVDFIEAVGTSALRRAANRDAFLAAMKAEAGVEIRVISGLEEAELATLSALHHFDMHNNRYGLIDIGGGSIEVITAAGSHIETIHSLDLGAVFLTEHLLPSDPITAKERGRLHKYLRKAIGKALGDEDFGLQCLIGSGGTVTNIGAMIMARRGEQYDSVHCYEVFHSEIVHLLAMLERKNCKERRAVNGLSPDRADIIVAGVAAVDALMRFFGTNLLKINAGGIREGLIIRSLKKRGLWALEDEKRDWISSALGFARSCHADEVHGEQVRRLALALFDAIPAARGLGSAARRMLEAAALLHDIGYVVSYVKHHKHSSHLIRHAELFDFSPREREIIANLARYHRKTLPRKKHQDYSRLSAEDQELVCKLGGILRLADGLDRRRSCLVRDLSCVTVDGKMVIRLASDEDLSVEIFGALAKADLFEAAFGQKVVLEHASDREQLPNGGVSEFRNRKKCVDLSVWRKKSHQA